jgi:3-carboxy-cis,cis-muconate cycloisomerase
MDRALSPLISPDMAQVFSPEAHVRGMLAFEAALARAEAQAGIIPRDAADAIGAACRVELFDVPAIFAEGARAGAPTIPFVRELTARIEGDAARYVHWGATSQDAIDTAFMLQARDGLELLTARLLEIAGACAQLAEAHRDTPMAGRTLQQQALPITFGLKAARWLALVTRQIVRLDALRPTLCVQFGGAVGTHASLGDRGLAAMEMIAADLGLAVPELPWHTERDRIAELAAALGVVAGAMGKLAGDALLLAQTEVGEASEGVEPGRGGSSTMPHKQNPVDATFARAASRLALGELPLIFNAMDHEHERAAGPWQVEWEALPRIFLHTAGAVERVLRLASGLVVDAERMRANLEITGGLVLAESLSMTLAARIGRPAAYALVKDACVRVRETGQSLEAVALADPQITAALDASSIHRALDPANYLGTSAEQVDRALAGYQALLATREG